MPDAPTIAITLCLAGLCAPTDVRVTDGDTLSIPAARWSEPMPARCEARERLLLRLYAIDAPEIDGKCLSERAGALAARDALAATMLGAGSVAIEWSGRVDRYCRPLVAVLAGGVDAADVLVARGFARPWEGKREEWCDAR